MWYWYQQPNLSSYRPVTLVSHLMETLEWLVLVHLHASMDPLKLTYQLIIGLDDTIISPVLSTAYSLQFWSTSWRTRGLTMSSHPGCWTTSATEHSVGELACAGHSCLPYRDATGNSCGPFPLHSLLYRHLLSLSSLPSSKSVI